MLLAELAAKVKAAGKTLHEKLDALYWQYGYHAEQTVSTSPCPAREGMADMQAADGRASAATRRRRWAA